MLRCTDFYCGDKYAILRVMRKTTGTYLKGCYRMKKKLIKLLCIAMACFMVIDMTVAVQANKIDDIRQQQRENQNRLNEINESLDDLETQQEILEEEISDLDAELINMMASIGILEDEIELKENDIQIAKGQFEEAKKQEEDQYEAMKTRMKFMYERGDSSYITMLLESESIADMVNKADYVEALYEYDRKLLEEYVATKQQIGQLQTSLEEQKSALESDMSELEEQQAYLDELLVQKRAASDDYDAQIESAKAQAAKYKKQIEKEAAEIKRLEAEEERKKKAAAVASGTYTVTAFDTSVISNSAGSELGKKIAMYGCQFIGNPYVMGGTSLTNGADCSGFIFRIYSDFGYSIPRTSYSQRSVGTEVTLANAQPGDIVCYSGHVGLYVGGGYIVHASTKKTGIKISKATYRSILSIRRVVN